MFSPTNLRDEIRIAMTTAREMQHDLGLTGHGVATLWTPQDGVKQLVPFANLITTAGDQYYATRGIAGIAPTSVSQPTLVNGMKLGTGTAVSAKSGTGSYIQTYTSSLNMNRNAFDTSYPQATAVGGTDTGYYAIYQCTWAAGSGTHTALYEAAVVTDASSDTQGSAANTIARVKFGTSVNKTAADSLTITWNHKFLGAAA